MEVEKKIGCMQGCLTAVGIFIAAMFGVLILISFSIKGCVSEINKGDGNAAINKNRPVDEKGFKYRDSEEAYVSEDGGKFSQLLFVHVLEASECKKGKNRHKDMYAKSEGKCLKSKTEAFSAVFHFDK